MLVASYARYLLDFHFVARTSREVMTTKETFLLRLRDTATGRVGTGECSLFRGLSADDRPDYESRLADMCKAISAGDAPDISDSSSLRFGYETAVADLRNGGCGLPFPSDFTDGNTALPINGLVWMDDVATMMNNARQKVADGFRCVKLKIGRYDFADELRIVEMLRRAYGPEKLEIRLDANGAYSVDEAIANLRRIEPLDIHSVEQPVKAAQWEAMAEVCDTVRQPVALDEELIGVYRQDVAREMLDLIRPAFLVLKPSLCGGFADAGQWIADARARGIGWWVTSALESNIGLNALAQWVATLPVGDMCQGLGTGLLYTNNFESPLSMHSGFLHYDPHKKLTVENVEWITPV